MPVKPQKEIRAEGGNPSPSLSFGHPYVVVPFTAARQMINDLRGLIARIDDLKTVPEGWNGGEGLPPQINAISLAQNTIEHLIQRGFSRPGLYPTEDGGVQAEWSSFPSWNVELCFKSDGRTIIGWSAYRPLTNILETQIVEESFIGESGYNRLVKWLTERSRIEF